MCVCVFVSVFVCLLVSLCVYVLARQRCGWYDPCAFGQHFSAIRLQDCVRICSKIVP